MEGRLRACAPCPDNGKDERSVRHVKQNPVAGHRFDRGSALGRAFWCGGSAGFVDRRKDDTTGRIARESGTLASLRRGHVPALRLRQHGRVGVHDPPPLLDARLHVEAEIRTLRYVWCMTIRLLSRHRGGRNYA